MKRYILVLTLGFILLSSANYAHAQQKGRLELGGMVGTPTGISAKGWVSENIALDGALTFNIGDNFSSVYLHSNILFHSNSLNENLGLTGSRANAYYGAGLRVLAGDFDEEVGLRFPGGITYAIEDTPMITFFEIVPTLDIISDVRFGLGGAVGLRFSLN